MGSVLNNSAEVELTDQEPGTRSNATEDKHSCGHSNTDDRFERVFTNSLAIMAIVKAPEMTYVDVNPAWERMWGYSRSEAVGKTPLDLNFQDCYAEGRQLAASDAENLSRPVEYVGYTKAGEKRTVLSQITVIQEEPERHILYVLLDLTQIRQYEQEMGRLDKLNMIGEMAAAIGHEIRNPMTTVRGYLQMLQMKGDLQHYQPQLNTMIEELDRANHIIGEYLSLAKNRTVEMRAGSMNSVLTSIHPLLQADAFQRGHVFVMDLQEVGDSCFDEREIRQLVVNLVRNGLEAMEQKGEICIRTYQQEGSTVLEIVDTGPGIPSEILRRLGTPFITTKEKGTGLGLAICYQIAERHQARINVSTGSRGTTFTVVFPSVQGRQPLAETGL